MNIPTFLCFLDAYLRLAVKAVLERHNQRAVTRGQHAHLGRVRGRAAHRTLAVNVENEARARRVVLRFARSSSGR